jgi:hypothetical protein
MKWLLAAVAFVVGALIWVAYFGRRGGALSMAKTELAVADAAAETKRIVAMEGREAALKKLDKEHRDALAKIRWENYNLAEKYRGDPVALARFLVRTGRRGNDSDSP